MRWGVWTWAFQARQPLVIVRLSSGPLLQRMASAPELGAWLETCFCFAGFVGINLGSYHNIAMPDILETPGNAHKEHNARVKEATCSFCLGSCAQPSHADLRHSNMPRALFARKTAHLVDGARLGVHDLLCFLEMCD